ncbi:hypothetical protein ACW95P_01795 [Candidatus Mycoplasma pogonae]
MEKIKNKFKVWKTSFVNWFKGNQNKTKSQEAEKKCGNLRWSVPKDDSKDQ